MSIGKPWYLYRPRQIPLRLWRSIRRPRPGSQLLPLPWGCSITIDPSKSIGRCIWTTGIYDLAVSELLARLIRPGDLVLDGGANVGYMSILMSLCAGSTGELISFEPHPSLFQSLQENLERLQREPTVAKVDLHNTALSDKSGDATFVIPADFERNDGIAKLDSNPVQAGHRISVRTETLDEVLQGRRVGVMKLDVEGHEQSVLRGALQALKERRIRDLIYEDHSKTSSPNSELLQAAGFTVFQIGWETSRLVLASMAGPSIAKPYESPSYLATQDPQFALKACASPGWRVLTRLLAIRDS